jgi:membrane protein
MRYARLLKQAASQWADDNATRLSAALAFYTMLSLAPLLVLAIKIVGVIFSEQAAKGQVTAYLSNLMGPSGAKTVAEMIGPMSQPGAGVLATVISIAVLLVSASGVFGELQDSLNLIWGVKPKPDRVISAIIKERFLSLVLVLGVCFLLMVSLVATTLLAGLTDHLGGSRESFLWESLNFVISLIVVTVLFALIFKYLPDVKVGWSDTWGGAIATGVLFSIGKIILGWYLGRASTTSVYGAAGSLIAVLLWVYYSAQILFFGAEVTHARAIAAGSPVEPTGNAVAVTELDRAREGIASNDRGNGVRSRSYPKHA